MLLRLRLPINHDTYVVLLSFQHLVYAFLRCFAGKLFRDSKSEGLAGNGLQPRNIQGVFGNEVVDIHGLLLAHSSAAPLNGPRTPQSDQRQASMGSVLSLRGTGAAATQERGACDSCLTFGLSLAQLPWIVHASGKEGDADLKQRPWRPVQLRKDHRRANLDVVRCSPTPPHKSETRYFRKSSCV